MHKELYIARGVMKTPGDALSAEQGLDAINLMDANGFALDPSNGWQPQIAGMKNGGVWSDTQTAPGRLLVAGQDGNVTETIRLIITTGDALSLYAQLARLNRFIATCRDMWTTFNQIEPVFLWWWAVGAPERQYALIYNVDIAVTYPDVTQGATADVTLTLEREPYWRALPPGANPKIWSYYARGEKMDSASDFNLADGTADNFVYDADVCNRMEFNNANLATTSITARNYIDIDGSRIPGDAPALMCMSIVAEVSQAAPLQLYIARNTRPKTLPSRASGGTITNYPLINTFNACNASFGTDTATAADTGGVRDYAGNQERVNISFATLATDAERIEWDITEGMSIQTLRGSYAVFVRARQVNGAFGDITMHLEIKPTQSLDAIILQDVNPVLLGTTGNSTGANGGWPLSYMGTFEFPFKGRAAISSEGNGNSADSPADIKLYARRASGTGVLYICDLIIIPHDEFNCLAVGEDNLFSTVLGNTNAFIGDGTGYFSHGTHEDVVQTNDVDPAVLAVSGTISYDNVELRGQWPQLEPGVNNRLFFLVDGSGSNRSVTITEMIVRINIVPRWRGVRDV